MRLLSLLTFGLTLCAQGVKAPVELAALQKQATEAREQNRPQDAIRLYRESVRQQPNWSEGWWYLGTLLYDQNSYAPARDALVRLVQLEPKAPPAAWALLGLCEFETKNYPESLLHLERSFFNEARDDPFARATRYHAALLLTKKAQFELALGRLAEISAPDTESADLIRAIGVAGLRMPILATGLPAAQQALADQVGRALFDGYVRREKDAELKYQALLTQYPGLPELHHLHGVALLTSDPPAAIAELKREIEISPRHVAARLQIAFEFLKQGDPAKALPYAREAVALEPNSFAAHAALGQALVDTDELAKGIVELEKARTLAPDSPETHRKLASAYTKAGRDKEATLAREIFSKLRALNDNKNR